MDNGINVINKLFSFLRFLPEVVNLELAPARHPKGPGVRPPHVHGDAVPLVAVVHLQHADLEPLEPVLGRNRILVFGVFEPWVPI